MVPEGWKKAPVRDFGHVSAGRQRSPHFTGGAMRRYLRVANVFEARIDTTDVNSMPFTDAEFGRYKLEKGDILLNEGQSTELVGRPAMYCGVPENCCFQNTLVRFKAFEHTDSNYALQRFLLCLHDGTFQKISKKTTSIAHLGVSRFAELVLAWPPLPEQKKIAQILSTWDQAITATERLLENSQQRKKGLMQQLLTGKKRLPGFEGEWREEELGKLVTISKGEQLNRSTLSEAGLYPVINGGITPSGYTDKTNCHGNTVTISEGGNSCGFVAFQQVPFWCGGHCYALKSPQVPVMFLYQLLKLYEVKIMRMRVGSGLPNIQKKDISSLKLCLPSCPDEQEAIGQILGLADKECRLLVDRLNSLKQEKKALMQQLLTGKRRVQVDTEAA